MLYPFYFLRPGFFSILTDTIIDVSPINGLQNYYDTPTHGSKGRKIERGRANAMAGLMSECASFLSWTYFLVNRPSAPFSLDSDSHSKSEDDGGL